MRTKSLLIHSTSTYYLVDSSYVIMCARSEDFHSNVGVTSLFFAFDVEIVSDNAKTHERPRGPLLTSQSDRSTSCRWASSCLESPKSPPPVPDSPVYECKPSQTTQPSRWSSDTASEVSRQGRMPKSQGTGTPDLDISLLRLPTILPLTPKKPCEHQDSFPPRIPPRSWLASS